MWAALIKKVYEVDAFAVPGVLTLSLACDSPYLIHYSPFHLVLNSL